MSLDILAKQHGTDKLAHGYLPHYRHHLGDPSTILEVGIGSGASLRMWEAAYVDARVMGVDVNPSCIYPDLECHHGDATNPATYIGWLPPTVEIVIDDGSHQAADVVATFDLLWPRVAEGGCYVIEDLACVRHPQFGGDEKGGPVLRLVADLVLRAVRGEVELHIYAEIAFIRRLPNRVPWASPR